MVETLDPELDRVDNQKRYIHRYYPKLHKMGYSRFRKQPITFSQICGHFSTNYFLDDWEEACVLSIRRQYLAKCARLTQRVLVSEL